VRTNAPEASGSGSVKSVGPEGGAGVDILVAGWFCNRDVSGGKWG